MSDVDCRAPELLKPSSWLRCPHSNAHTNMPKVAPIVKTFIATAISGRTTEPRHGEEHHQCDQDDHPEDYWQAGLEAFLQRQEGRRLSGNGQLSWAVQRLKIVDGSLGCW